jgi:hypothetical protein
MVTSAVDLDAMPHSVLVATMNEHTIEIAQLRANAAKHQQAMATAMKTASEAHARLAEQVRESKRVGQEQVHKLREASKQQAKEITELRVFIQKLRDEVAVVRDQSPANGLSSRRPPPAAAAAPLQAPPMAVLAPNAPVPNSNRARGPQIHHTRRNQMIRSAAVAHAAPPPRASATVAPVVQAPPGHRGGDIGHRDKCQSCGRRDCADDCQAEQAPTVAHDRQYRSNWSKRWNAACPICRGSEAHTNGCAVLNGCTKCGGNHWSTQCQASTRNRSEWMEIICQMYENMITLPRRHLARRHEVLGHSKSPAPSAIAMTTSRTAPAGRHLEPDRNRDRGAGSRRSSLAGASSRRSSLAPGWSDQQHR